MTRKRVQVNHRYMDLERAPAIPFEQLPVLPVLLLTERPVPPPEGCRRCHARRLWTEPVVTDSGVVPTLWHWRCFCGWEGADYRRVKERIRDPEQGQFDLGELEIIDMGEGAGGTGDDDAEDSTDAELYGLLAAPGTLA